MPEQKQQVHEPILGKPQSIDSLASYQKDSIVSTRLIHKSTGNVTFFAFDERQELSEHTAPFDALAHILEGEAEVTISGAPYRLSAGDAIIMPANEPHALKAIQKFKMLLTMIRA